MPRGVDTPSWDVDAPSRDVDAPSRDVDAPSRTGAIRRLSLKH